MHKRLLLALLLVLAACGSQPAALAPTAAPPAAPSPVVAPPAAVLLPTLEAPTAITLPTTLSLPTAAPPTAIPPTAMPTATPTAAVIAAPQSTARSAASAPVRLVIPEIKLDRELFSVGLDSKRIPVVPKHDIGWYNLSAAPGEGENIVLWGHVLRFKATPKIPAPFARLKELPVGAQLTLYSADGVAHPYVIVEKVWATPDQVEYILPTGRELLTLVSCIGDKVVAAGNVEMSHRLITIAAPAQ